MSEEKGMKRLARIVALGALISILAAGVAQAALRFGNDKPNTFRGTLGDNKGQATFFGLGAGDTLVGTSAADQLAGGSDPDRLEGNDGNDNLDGGARGEQDLHGK
jgi:Ca2+-binding RTX toxin-like protein